MNEPLEPLNGRDHDAADDRRIRQLLTMQPPAGDLSAEIERRVLGKVVRRRRIVRTARTGAVAGMIALALLLSRDFVIQKPPADGVATRAADADVGEFVGEHELFGADELQFVSVAAAPPVTSLGMVAADQSALLQGLKFLLEE